MNLAYPSIKKTIQTDRNQGNSQQTLFIYCAALVSALLLFLASPGQFSFAPLAWFALIPLLAALKGCSPGKAARAGFFCGIIYYISILYWITIVLGKYGNLPWWITVPALLLLAAYMATYLAIFSAGIAWSRGSFPLTITAPVLWVALDYTRGKLFTGFPWLDLGYSQYNSPQLIQLADLAGHAGVTFIVVTGNCLLITLLEMLRRSYKWKILLNKELIPALIILAAATAYNITQYKQFNDQATVPPQINIAMAQGNIDQSQKWLPHNQRETIKKYVQLSGEYLTDKKTDLLIWPETALPFFPLGHPLFESLTRDIIRPDGPVFLTGAPHYTLTRPETKATYYNSAFTLTPNTKPSPENTLATLHNFHINRYDKQHLVPFGEYIPFGKYIPSSLPIVHSMGNFSAGTSSEPIPCHNARIGVLICYESIFPDLARKAAEKGANLLVNLTNDAWYGKSSAPWQQLAMVVFRAVETRKSFARAANTGISCFIDPLGRQIQISPLFEPYSMATALPLLEETSPFTRYGHNFPVLCLLALIPMALVIRKKNRNYTESNRLS